MVKLEYICDVAIANCPSSLLQFDSPVSDLTESQRDEVLV